MDNNQVHIEQIIKEKLNGFEATPPEYVWAGIEEHFLDQKQPLLFTRYAKQFVAAAALIIAAIALWYFIPENEHDQISRQEIIEGESQPETGSSAIIDEEATATISEENTEKDSADNSVAEETTTSPAAESSLTKVLPETASADNPKKQSEQTPDKQHGLTWLDSKKVSSIEFSNTGNENFGNTIENTVNFSNRKSESFELPLTNEMQGFQNYWTIGLYFTPEMMFNTIDSVTLLNTYALNIEPSWYFSKHWFMRFGAGVSYVRDRGFAKVDFISEWKNSQQT
jgi:hypothetical protein